MPIDPGTLPSDLPATVEQVQFLIDAVMFAAGVGLANIFASTWRG